MAQKKLTAKEIRDQVQQYQDALTKAMKFGSSSSAPASSAHTSSPWEQSKNRMETDIAKFDRMPERYRNEHLNYLINNPKAGMQEGYSSTEYLKRLRKAFEDPGRSETKPQKQQPKPKSGSRAGDAPQSTLLMGTRGVLGGAIGTEAIDVEATKEAMRQREFDLRSRLFQEGIRQNRALNAHQFDEMIENAKRKPTTQEPMSYTEYRDHLRDVAEHPVRYFNNGASYAYNGGLKFQDGSTNAERQVDFEEAWNRAKEAEYELSSEHLRTKQSEYNAKQDEAASNLIAFAEANLPDRVLPKGKYTPENVDKLISLMQSDLELMFEASNLPEGQKNQLQQYIDEYQSSRARSAKLDEDLLYASTYESTDKLRNKFMARPDFAEKSSEPLVARNTDPFLGFLYSAQDTVYRFLADRDQRNAERDSILSNPEIGPTVLASGEDPVAPEDRQDYITDEDVRVIRYLYNTGDYQEALRYMDEAQRAANLRYTEEIHEGAGNAVDRSALHEWGMNRLRSLEKAALTPFQSEAVKKDPAAIFGPLFEPNQLQGVSEAEIRQKIEESVPKTTIGKNFDEKIGNKINLSSGQLTSFLYGSGNSIIDNLIRDIPAQVTGIKGFQELALLIMGSEAASDALYNDIGRGMSYYDAIEHAAQRAVTEYFTEKIPSEAAFKFLPDNKYLTYLGKSGGAEGLEEGVGGLADMFYDRLKNNPHSEHVQNTLAKYDASRSQYEAAKAFGATGKEPISWTQAEQQATIDEYKEIAEEAASAFLSVVPSGTFHYAIGSIQGKTYNRILKNMAQNNVLNDQIEAQKKTIANLNEDLKKASSDTDKQAIQKQLNEETARLQQMEDQFTNRGKKIEKDVKKLKDKLKKGGNAAADDLEPTQASSVQKGDLGDGKTIQSIDKDGNIMVSDGTTMKASEVDWDPMPATKELYDLSMELKTNYGIAPSMTFAAYTDGQSLGGYESAVGAIASGAWGNSELSDILAHNEDAKAIDPAMAQNIYDAAKAMGEQDIQRRVAENQGRAKLIAGSGSVTITQEAQKVIDSLPADSSMRSSVELLSGIFKETGIKATFFASKAGEDGRYVGERGSVNDEATAVRIDVNSGHDMTGDTLLESAVAQVGSHELTHVIATRNPEGYKQLLKAVSDSLTKQGMSLYDFARQNMADYKASGKDIDQATAMEEAVAQGFERVLKDSNFAETVAKKNPSLARQIADWFKDFAKKLKDIFKKGEYLTVTSRAMENYVNQYAKVWDDALAGISITDAEQSQLVPKTNEFAPADVVEAAQNAKQVEQTDNAEPEIMIESSDGEPLAASIDPEGNTVARYSFRTWTSEEEERVRRELKATGKFSAQEIDKWISDINSVHAVIGSDMSRLDYEAADNQVMLKPNAEYVVSLDASTLCAKRRIYQGTFDAIQHRMPDRVMTSDMLIDLRNMLAEAGYESPCGICYVESRRRNLGIFTKKFLDNYEGDSTGFKPRMDDLTTDDGLEMLRHEHPEAYDAFIKAMAKTGSNNPKVVQPRTEYRGDIKRLTPAQIKRIVEIGGLRISSFSDFETPHLIDMMQAVLDMSSNQLTAQAYTKVPNFPAVFGDTGIKINLSLIADGTGLDENGNLLFSSYEGMDINDAKRLRDMYPDNVGTILVGMNDDHILAAMASPDIDFIIPFHKSGWGKRQLEQLSGMRGYKDYTRSQNEREVVGTTATGKPKTKNVASNFYPIDYWDYSKTGKENAEAYLKLCADSNRIPKFSQFLVDNGDGSYSLQPDGSTDGYWKLLIDFKMYNHVTGKGAPQRAVTPNVNMQEAMRVLAEYEGGANDLPVARDVVDRFVSKYSKGGQDSAGQGTRKSLRTGRDADYMAAVEKGDMDAAQSMVDEAAKENGYGYVRYTRRSLNPKNNAADYYMFVEADKEGLVAGTYGNNKYFATDKSAIDMDDISQEVEDAWNNFAEENGWPEWEEGFDINPDDIVDSAGIFDNTDFIQYLFESGFFDRFGDETPVIRTHDGLVVFGDDYNVIKSGDPVTYDDSGEPIPLSERFNPQNPDIRYSLRTDREMTDREVLGEAMKEIAPAAGDAEYLTKYQDAYRAMQNAQRELAKQQQIMQGAEQNSNEYREAKNRADVFQKRLADAEAKLDKLEKSGTFTKLVKLERRRAEKAAEELAKRDREIGRLEGARNRLEQQLANSRQRLIDYRRARNESADRSRYIERITDTVKDLSTLLATNSDKKHVPEALKRPLGDFLRSLNLYSKRSNEGGPETKKDIKLSQYLSKVRDAIQGELVGDDSSLYIPQDIANMLKSVQTSIESLESRYQDADPIVFMDNANLKDLDTALRALKKAIGDVNKMFYENQFKTVSEASNTMYDELMRMKQAKGGVDTNIVSQHLNKGLITPVYFFDRLGKAGTPLFNSLRRGYSKFAQRMYQIEDFAQKTWNAKDVAKWKKTVRDFKYTHEDGSTVSIKLTEAQIMTLYMYNKRPAAMRHVDNGGGVLASNIKDGKKDLIRQIKAVQLTREDIRDIVSTLTPEQKAVCDAVSEFLKIVGEWGNEVSMRRFGYRAFGEDNYFQILTNDKERNAMSENGARGTDLYKMLNMSFTKSLDEKASNSLVIDDFFNIFANHTADMAKYSTMALPVLDTIRVLNYRDKDTKVITRDAMENAYGKNAERYLINFLSDLSSVTRVDERMPALEFIRNAKVASVTGNMSVVLKQGLSIARAGIVLPELYSNPTRMIREQEVFGYKKHKAEMLEHSGIARWKSMNYYDMDTGRPLEQRIAGGETGLKGFHEWVVDKSGTGAEVADTLTLLRMWDVCKKRINKTQPGLQKGSQEYWDAVNEIFEDAVYRTQVVDGVMNRSDVMRSKSTRDKLLTAFMAEPILTYNTFADSVNKMRMEKQIEGKISKKTAGLFARAFAAYAINGIGESLISALMKAIRDDDDYTSFLEKFKVALIGKEGDTPWERISSSALVDGLNPLGWIPLAKQVINALKGDSSGMDTVSLEYLTKAFDDAKKWAEWEMSDEKDPGKMPNVANTINTFVRAMSYISGSPMYNILRDAKGLWNSTMGEDNPALKIQLRNPSASSGYSALYDAILAGNESEIARLEAALKRHDAWDKVDSKTGKVTNEGGKAEEAIRDCVKADYLGGGMDYETAEKILIEHGGADKVGDQSGYHYLHKWAYENANIGATYSKYTPMDLALKADDSKMLDEAKGVLGTNYGMKDKDIESQVATRIGNLLKAGDITEAQAKSLYDKYTDKSDLDIDKALDKARYQADNPDADMDEDYTYYQGLFDLVDKGSSITAEVKKNYPYSTTEQINDAVRSYIKGQYFGGASGYSRATVEKKLVQYGLADDANDAFWTMESWEYKNTHNGDTYSYINEMVSAMDAGSSAGIVKAANKYLSHGKKADNVVTQLVKYYKPKWQTSTANERVEIQKQMAAAMQALGIPQDKITKKINSIPKDWAK